MLRNFIKQQNKIEEKTHTIVPLSKISISDPKNVSCLAEFANGKLAIGYTNGAISILDRGLNKCLITLYALPKLVKLMILDSEELVSISESGINQYIISIWNPSLSSSIEHVYNGQLTDIAILPHANLATVDSLNATITIWNTGFEKIDQIKLENEDKISGITVTPDGNLLIGVYVYRCPPPIEDMMLYRYSHRFYLPPYFLHFYTWNYNKNILLKSKEYSHLDPALLPCERLLYITDHIIYYKPKEQEGLFWDIHSEQGIHIKYLSPIYHLDVNIGQKLHAITPLIDGRFMSFDMRNIYVWDFEEQNRYPIIIQTYQLKTPLINPSISMRLRNSSVLTQSGILDLPCVKNYRKDLEKSLGNYLNQDLVSMVLEYQGFFSYKKQKHNIEKKIKNPSCTIS